MRTLHNESVDIPEMWSRYVIVGECKVRRDR